MGKKKKKQTAPTVPPPSRSSIMRLVRDLLMDNGLCGSYTFYIKGKSIGNYQLIDKRESLGG